ncbi:MAG: tetratricopeptide repeat protein [Polyangiales bacterium]
MLKNSLLSLTLIMALAPSQNLSAQDVDAAASVEAPVDNDEQARVLYLRGDRLYSEGRYEEATAAFRESYELSGRPGLLFNIANAYERLGQLEEALQALQRFAPNAPEHQRATVNTRIANIEERLREQDEARRAAEADTETVAAVVPPADVAPAEQAPESSSAAKPVGIALIAVGTAAVGGGLVAALLARSSRGNLDDACMGSLCPASASGDFDAEKRRALAADILLFGGGALVIGGVIALIAGPSDDDEGVAHIDVAPTRGGASATLSGRF